MLVKGKGAGDGTGDSEAGKQGPVPLDGQSIGLDREARMIVE
jgi:hypothetical protein